MQRESNRSAGLRRELGLRDLTLFAIACIIGTRWIASAAHAGPGSILLWFLAAIFFLIPLAIAVAVLTVKHPEAGGLYRWTRADFGPWHGFLAFWVYWIAIAVWFPSAAMFYASTAASALGFPENRTTVMVASLAAIWIALGTNLVGLRIGKWTENLGASASWALGLILVATAALVWRRHGSATGFHLLPAWNWSTLSYWATIAYAMTGVEMIGLMGSEIRDVKRDMPRAALISSVFATLFYAGSTGAVLVLLPSLQINELTGLVQAGGVAGQILGAAWLPSVIGLLILASAIGQFGGLGSSVSRMPFAAGLDHLMPAALSRIHPRWRTPWVSIIAFGVLASCLLVLMQLGDTLRAAYETLVSLMVIAGFLPFLYVFSSAWKAGGRWSAISGIAMTILAVVCSLVPAGEIHNVWLFEFKVVGGTAVVIVSARLVYREMVQRASSPAR